MVQFSSTQRSFYGALEDTYAAFQVHGARSSKKLVSLHGWFHDAIEARYPDFVVMSMRQGSKEAKVPGSYYPKNVDVAVFQSETKVEERRPLLVLSIKFAINNYRQNSNNYFEGLLGETSNLQSNGVPVTYFSIIRDEYRWRRKDGSTKGFEYVNDHDLAKYIQLFDADPTILHRPQAFGLEVVSLDEVSGQIGPSDFSKIPKVREATRDRLREDLSIEPFMQSLFEIVDRRAS